jgi:hypothetical protein
MWQNSAHYCAASSCAKRPPKINFAWLKIGKKLRNQLWFSSNYCDNLAARDLLLKKLAEQSKGRNVRNADGGFFSSLYIKKDIKQLQK